MPAAKLPPEAAPRRVKTSGKSAFGDNFHNIPPSRQNARQNPIYRRIFSTRLSARPESMARQTRKRIVPFTSETQIHDSGKAA